MIFGSVCSGIESASVAWHPLGWRAAFFAEIEPFPCAVLAHHYPEVQNLGDITRFREWPDAKLDVLVGGTPCQAFSIAGLRMGLADPRGNLTLTYLGIAGRYRPRWVAWENVPGVLSVNQGRPFGAFLGGLAELGYGFAYRILDAQYFGLAQRRARVFVVACLGNWRAAAAVLFDSTCLSGNPAPSREAPKDLAGTLTRSAVDGSGAGGGDGRQGLMIAHTLRGGGFDASEDGSGRGTPLVVAQTLSGGGRRSGGYSTDDVPLIAHTLTAKGGCGRMDYESETLICFDETQITSDVNRSSPRQGDPAHPLAARGRPPTIAFDSKASGRNGFAVGPISPTLRAMGHKDSHSNGGGQVAAVPSLGARRLTPLECERLQGFPDDYTLIPYHGRAKALAKDGPRYKALGNSKAVPVVRWIGRRLAAVDELLQGRAA